MIEEFAGLHENNTKNSSRERENKKEEKYI